MYLPATGEHKYEWYLIKKIIKELIVKMSNNRGVSKFSTMIAYLWLVDKLFVKTIKNLWEWENRIYFESQNAQCQHHAKYGSWKPTIYFSFWFALRFTELLWRNPYIIMRKSISNFLKKLPSHFLVFNWF